jgi:hypothetical protein
MTILYQSASRVFGDQFTSEVVDLLSTLQSSLEDVGGCSGNDEVSAAFADTYDQAALRAGQTVGELADAGATVALLLQKSGFNRARAGAPSNMDSDDLVDTRTYQSASPQRVAMASLHGGGLCEIPAGWERAAEPFGGVWPAGDPGKLRQVGAAWKTAAGSLDGLWNSVGIGMSALEGPQSPGLEQARIVCRSLGEAATVLAGQCRAIGDAVVAHAEQIEKVREGVTKELSTFVLETIAIEADALSPPSRLFRKNGRVTEGSPGLWKSIRRLWRSRS